MDQIQVVIREEGAQEVRERKFNMVVVVLVVVAMSLYTYLSIEHVIKRVAQGLRFIWPDPDYAVPAGCGWRESGRPASLSRRSPCGIFSQTAPKTSPT